MKVSSEAYAQIGRELLNVAQSKVIPYVTGGMTMDGMDCQGLCEYLLVACGLPAAECNLKGSNAHWRGCVWRGMPEECVALFGCVPVGAWVFIVDDGGGEVARGYVDGLGDANHMGVYLGDGVAIHASASRGCVAESVFREKTIPNGGWNAVGLPMWVDFGEDVDEVDEVVAGAGGGDGASGVLGSASAVGLDGLTGGDASASGVASGVALGSAAAGLDGLTGGEAADSGVASGVALGSAAALGLDGLTGGDAGASGVASGSAAAVGLDGLSAGASAGVRYATVQSPDGNPVKLRKTASRREGVYWLVSHGARVRVERERGDWSLITALCADGHIRRAYMMSAYLAA